MEKLLTVGVVGSSLKENEKRVAIHPEHIKRIPPKLREQITFEKGYGLKFGVDDNVLAELTSGRVASKEEILKKFDCVIIAKPLAEDLSMIRREGIVWGWMHCVQQEDITQVSIDRQLTLIAWEGMYKLNQPILPNVHIFHKNNEIAGYAGVNHAISLQGITGNYGKSRKVAVLGFGSVSRGAIYALMGQGFKDITVYTHTPFVPAFISGQIPGIKYKQIKNDESGKLFVAEATGGTQPFIEKLLDVEIIVNGILQDINNPITFVSSQDSKNLMKGCLIIDISCDEGMGFWCAKPTSFEHPMFEVEGKYYYSVDHTPSYYWNSASWEISKALLPFLGTVIGGPNEWAKDETISKAIEIRVGVIQNPQILSFQNREKKYPHIFHQ